MEKEKEKMAEVQEHLQQHGNGAAAAVAASGFSLPEHIIAVLPSDPYEQLDLASKITSIALATRLAKLEDEAAGLRAAVADRDNLIGDLRVRIDSLGASLAELSGQLTSAQEEKETLLNENASLSSTVKKLNRDVSKLEVFKRTLMQSLQEEDESPQASDSRKAHMQIKKSSILSSGSLLGAEEDSSNPPLKSSSASETRNAISYEGDSSAVDGMPDTRVSKHMSLKSLNLPSHDGTPRLTPPDSPPKLVTGLTPKRLSRPLSPIRHSISVATTRNTFDDRSEIFKSMPPTHSSSMTSPFDTGAHTGRTRVDGKEFFSRVRSRLSYDQFSAFIANVKDLNSHKQTREETLRKAGEIFGPINKDLYTNFDGLINRNLH